MNTDKTSQVEQTERVIPEEFSINTDDLKFTDRRAAINWQACRGKRYRGMGDAVQCRYVADRKDSILELSGCVWADELPSLYGSAIDFRLLRKEVMRLMLTGESFTLVISPEVGTPTGETIWVPGTNNEMERALRRPPMDRKNGSTGKKMRGARRCSVLESIRWYVPRFTLSSVVKEITSWQRLGQNCLARQLAILHNPANFHNHAKDHTSVLHTFLPIPGD